MPADDGAQDRRVGQMEFFDRLPDEVRALANEFTLEAVMQVVSQIGTDPAVIRRVLETNRARFESFPEQQEGEAGARAGADLQDRPGEESFRPRLHVLRRARPHRRRLPRP